MRQKGRATYKVCRGWPSANAPVFNANWARPVPAAIMLATHGSFTQSWRVEADVDRSGSPPPLNTIKPLQRRRRRFRHTWVWCLPKWCEITVHGNILIYIERVQITNQWNPFLEGCTSIAGRGTNSVEESCPEGRPSPLPEVTSESSGCLALLYSRYKGNRIAITFDKADMACTGC